MFDGTRLRDLMALRDVSQSELARKVGVSQTTIAKLVLSKGYGSKHLHRIARELGTSPAYLEGETDDPDDGAAPSPEFSSDELAWVHYWRALKGEERDAVIRVVRLLIGNRGHPIQNARVA